MQRAFHNKCVFQEMSLDSKFQSSRHTSTGMEASNLNCSVLRSCLCIDSVSVSILYVILYAVCYVRLYKVLHAALCIMRYFILLIMLEVYMSILSVTTREHKFILYLFDGILSNMVDLANEFSMQEIAYPYKMLLDDYMTFLQFCRLISIKHLI